MDRNTRVTLQRGADWNEIAAAVGLICDTSTDGMEEWLAAAAFPYRRTIQQLATEWDEFNSRDEEGQPQGQA
jgi:hypothetical protein